MPNISAKFQRAHANGAPNRGGVGSNRQWEGSGGMGKGKRVQKETTGKDFVARRYASAAYVVLNLSIRRSVCPSVCLLQADNVSKWCMVIGTMPQNSAGNLAFCCQRPSRNSTRVTSTGAPNKGGLA